MDLDFEKENGLIPAIVQDDSSDDGNYQGFETPRRKRGFFERIFGIGGDDEARIRKKKERQSDNENSSIY